MPIKCGMLLRLSDLMNFIFIFISSDKYSKERTWRLISIQRKEQLTGFCQKTLILACIWTYADWFLPVPGLIWWQTSLNCIVWYQFGWPWPSSSCSCLRKRLLHSFFADLLISYNEIWYAAKTCWLVQGHAKICLHDWYSKERTLLLRFYRE